MKKAEDFNKKRKGQSKRKVASKKTDEKKTLKKKVSNRSTVKKAATSDCDKSTSRRRCKKKKPDPQDLDYLYSGRRSKWFIVEINENLDIKDKYEEVVQKLKDICGEDVKYFIPMYVEYIQDKLVSLTLFEGYVFVKAEENVNEECFKEKTEYFKGLLHESGVNSYARNKDINNFKQRLKKMLKNNLPKKGQIVIPKTGDYKNLEGLVLSVDKRKMIARIEFALASRIVEVKIKIINLEILE